MKSSVRREEDDSSAMPQRKKWTVDICMGVDHRRGFWIGIWSGGLSPQILSCCKILSTRLVALQCRKMCFCLYGRTFIVSPGMRPPEFQSDLRLWTYEYLANRSGRGRWASDTAGGLEEDGGGIRRS